MVNFDLFVLPFLAGLVFVLLVVILRGIRWITALSAIDRVRFFSGIRNPRLMVEAVLEISMEGLIHRRLWKKNPALGYMHMSFALGWLLLIVAGNLESRYYSGTHLNAPYYPIFLKYFIHDKVVVFFEVYSVPVIFRFLMDLLLLFVLSGLAIALLKRRKSRWFGMVRVTRHRITDRWALAALWLIFPMRLLAESFTAGFFGHGGGFLTQNLGALFMTISPLRQEWIAYGLWWGYSLTLGTFFFLLPWSRYMHIPAEVMLIIFRRFGIRPGKWHTSFSEAEVQSCSKCGVCIDGCPMIEAGIVDSQAVYFLGGVRTRKVPEELSRRCLLCGKCSEACPVGIRQDPLRLIRRRELSSGQAADFSFLAGPPDWSGPREPDQVAYFSGCMSQLTPAIARAMKGLLDEAGIPYIHIDEDRSVCCGRPMMLAGKDRQAAGMIERNKRLLHLSGARTLVVSCPICYKVFREEYNLTMRILHHSQFLHQLLIQGKLRPSAGTDRIAYHDPCDLGRGTGVFEAPRAVLTASGTLVPAGEEGRHSVCCGGSLGMFEATDPQRNAMTDHTIRTLMAHGPDRVATACPLCKKTLQKRSTVPVKDIAEILMAAIDRGKPAEKPAARSSHREVPVG